MKKIVQILMLIITILASLSIVFFAIKYNPAKELKVDPFLSFSFYSVYGLFILAAICLIGFGFWSFVNNIKGSKTSLIGIGTLMLVFFTSYILSAPTTSRIEQKFAVTHTLSKLIGGGLIATYIFLIGAILVAIWFSLSSKFK